ncbi:polyketide synthase [Pseudomonas sp. 13.2]|uniref:Polyketide synthase n=1 Tax=Pseudomonas sp. 13.2 TaxID=3144665 RepID=A0AAU7BKG6_9PSED
MYLGIAGVEQSYRLLEDLSAIDGATATGNTMSIAANRLSFFYDLRGPSMAIDTACSSSLVAFHQACQAILSGDVDQAVTGGISLHMHPFGFMIFAKATMLSRTGRCQSFDENGDGYARSEGGGLFLLKDYDQAVADGNTILAVVAASAVNTDGRKSSLTLPNAEAQAALLKRAYAQAGIAPEQLDYLEAHGTGTAVGDPIETRAIGEALGQARGAGNPLPIGSVKSNLGHLEAASGVAGLMKALNCLAERTVPATIGVQALNPNIAFADLNLQVVTEPLPLKADGQLTVGVNSFGFGGANAHVILQSPEPQAPAAQAASARPARAVTAQCQERTRPARNRRALCRLPGRAAPGRLLRCGLPGDVPPRCTQPPPAAGLRQRGRSRPGAGRLCPGPDPQRTECSAGGRPGSGRRLGTGVCLFRQRLAMAGHGPGDARPAAVRRRRG